VAHRREDSVFPALQVHHVQFTSHRVDEDGGGSWGVRTRLNGEPMSLDWLSETTLGRMLGDYISVSWVGGRVIPVLSLAGEPGITMAQAIFATRATS